MTRRLALFALAALATACVHRVPTPVVLALPPPRPRPTTARALTAPDRTIHFAPIEIKSSPASMAVDSLNDEELFAIGTAAMASGDNAKAVLHFERLADFFPASKHRPKALYDSGLLLEKMKDFAGAVGRFTQAVKAFGETTKDGIDARFKLADAYFFLGEYDAAQQVLQALAQAPEVTPLEQAQADTRRGIVLFTAGRLDEAELLLRKTIDFIHQDLADEVQDEYLPSQAEFYVAEIFRQHFLQAKLDPATSTKEELINDLEYKAQMLLSAQGHYLRCIRFGHPEWATASGFRIGELYQKLYGQMVNSKVPLGLNAEEAQVYRDELKSRIRVLVTKAIDAYEETLSTAQRVGATNPFVAETRAELDQMKSLLVQDGATAKTAPGKPAPTPPPAKGSS